MFKLLGSLVISFIDELGNITILGLRAMRSIVKGKVQMRNVIDQMAWLGVNSLAVSVTTAAFVGMVFATQIVTKFSKLGAISMVGGIVGLAVWRELAPILTAVVLAGRIGAAIAAELGSMKVTDQIDAMESMAVSPVDYLVAPRVLSCVFMLPVLIIFADLIGFLGGYFVSVFIFSVNPVSYFTSASTMLTVTDIWPGIFIKGPIFGLIISMIATYKGLSAKGGARGVGEVTTSAVVLALVSIFVSNYFLSQIIFR
ncbi:MAG: ABC transporter permease [Candidatus Margulisiibacteriota bacterium]|nr:MAG: hypothetical protein A2X42_11575 [Candidatus Margulisbacteria bacterium GWF2_38_17]OGI11265.1 MAG: hypothetical protein A2X41_04000 [Candidatus Margulisbacteria bacterium GWE2_39_32]PZM78514.1 MAG: ABC transporter permease [Candidatus Margulisiibacteriota bacterium]HCY37628.1 ABC transporter permease [Candidatus Margulisiibacteriota bacterium]